MPLDQKGLKTMLMTHDERKDLTQPSHNQTHKSKKPTLRKLSPRHLMILDELIANPLMTNKQVADKLGFTQAWVSTVKGTDLFQEELAFYRKIRANEMHRTVMHKTEQLDDKVTDLLLERVTEESDTISTSEAIALKGQLDKSIGVSEDVRAKAAASQNMSNVQINVTQQVSADVLEEARQRMLTGGRAQPAIEHE